jgi:hypothetical protein
MRRDLRWLARYLQHVARVLDRIQYHCWAGLREGRVRSTDPGSRCVDGGVGLTRATEGERGKQRETLKAKTVQILAFEDARGVLKDGT